VTITRRRRRKDDVQLRFQALAANWREATKYVSSTTQMVANHDYLKIVSMGQQVVPSILRSLEREADHWAPALAAITGADPTTEKERGDVRATANAWLGWARERGIRW
jgi:hypothetical protein